VAISQAVVLNIGTLHERTIQAMYAAGQAANQLGIPVVLDPVGAGASGLRTETAARLIRAVKLAVIRGNLSEMKALAGQAAGTRGVDASAADAVERDSLRAVTDFAKSLAQKTGSVIALTGAIDVVSDGVRCCAIHNGHAMMARITGTGCMCSSLVGACCGATDDYAVAAAAGVMVMGVAGELALEALQSAGLGSGSYRSYIIDAVSHMTGQVLVERGKADFE
jgi:hydroxyethylthiazole kinase